MPSSAKGLIHALGPLAYNPITIVHLLSGQVFLKSLSCLTVWINPTIWIPFGVIFPDLYVGLSECRGSEDSVTLWDDALAIFRWGGKGTRDYDVRYDRALCRGERR